VRAAHALAKDASRSAREALCSALGAEPFWGALVEIGRALAETHAAWAKTALIAARRNAHPKARRGIAEALGKFSHDADVAAALVEMLQDPSYLVVAAALESLGRTHEPNAFEILVEHLGMPSWNDTIASGAARGLGESGDPRAVHPLIDATRDDRGDDLRRAALSGLARLSHLLDERKPSIVEAIVACLADEKIMIRLAAIGAAERLGERDAIGALRRISDRDGDARLRRAALEAIDRISEAQRAPAEVAKLRTEIAELREELQTLRARLP
ncbi:MAG: HEAT repeat domain-containing protein, partial [Polyangiaceae bacterium]